jgi:ABC-type nickel/cobalt efflux system permease component RcnA
VTRTTRRAGAIVLGLIAALVLPAVAFAHPLGNFTINHYAGIQVETDRILLDVVIDQAEIPTFQARLTLDTDGDGELSDAETEAARVAACGELAPSLTLSQGGTRLQLEATDAGLEFPAGVGGLSTMRTVCEFRATLPSAITAASTSFAFEDRSFPDRIGWREIVVVGSGAAVTASRGSKLRTEGVSNRLTHYPANLLPQSLADARVEFSATPGGTVLAPYTAADAQPLPAPRDATAVADATAVPAPPAGTTQTAAVKPASVAGTGASTASAETAGSIPGGVTSGELPAIFRTADLTPIVLLVSLLTAAALGASHALTPGHGKTLMAAYLVGTRGTPLHAAGLGLSVALSHTVGILILASLVVGAQGILPPDLVVRTAPVIAAVSILVIGAWMVVAEAKRRRRAHRAGAAHAAEHDHEHTHEDEQDHAHADAHGHEDSSEQEPAAAGLHSHGGMAHSHLPPSGSTLTWRNLFVLGLAGGLIPSASALLILLGSIAAGRPAFGFILVVAFGLGMALVMSGIGLVLVLARGRLDRVDAGSRLGRFSSVVPLLASCLVVGLGLYLTFQALSGSPTF